MKSLGKDIGYRKRIEIIKSNIGLSDILGTKPHGSSDCPFCKKKKKWSSWNDKWGICWSSSCVINKNYRIPGRNDYSKRRFDVIEAFKLKYSISDFKACISGLEHFIGEKKITDVIQKVDNRSNLINKCLSIFQQELWGPGGKEALDYLLRRGFDKQFILSLNIGYASNPYILRKWGITIEELEYLGIYDEELDREYFSRRVIFPIRDIYGRFVHLQGRYIRDIPEENGEPKWPRYKSTKSINIDPIDSYLLFEERLSKYQNLSNTLFISEGAPDTYSLVRLGFPAVGIFGLNNLLKNVSKFKSFKYIYVIADNDKFSDEHIYYPGEYKSWRVLIPQLIDIQYLLPNTDIYLWMPPEDIGKDVNDLLRLGFNHNQLKEDIKENSKELVSYCIESMGQDISQHETLLRLISITDKCKDNMRELIKGKDVLDYALEIFSV
jgi:hypothetical protein